MQQNSSTRLLPIENAYNIRDLGGYATPDGKRVKWRKVIRSGDQNNLSAKDIDYLEYLGIKTFIDFRSEQEIKAAPDKTVPGLTKSVWLPIIPGDMISAVQQIKSDNIPSLIGQVYEKLVHDYREEYKEFFRLLAGKENTPVLFHCSAGKDRTGIGAALFLASLGIDRDTIMQDYLLSKECLRGKYDFIIKNYPQFEPLTTVEPGYLQKALDAIDRDFAGMENYLTNELKVDLSEMRNIYLE